jgi:hypothetical protein
MFVGPMYSFYEQLFGDMGHVTWFYNFYFSLIAEKIKHLQNTNFFMYFILR